MEFGFDGQVVVVTGAGQGLGRSYAVEFASRGALVVVNDIAKDPGGGGAAQAVVDAIEQGGGRAWADDRTIDDPSVSRELVADVVSQFGRVDVLVNNAGTTGMVAFDEQPLAEFDALMDVHVRGPFTLTQAAFRQMCDQGYGRIVFTSSSAGVFGRAMGSGYSTAKGALIGMMNTLSLDALPHGVLVNAILPSATTSIRGFDRSALSPTIRDSLDHLKDYASPEFVVPLVVYLASRECGVTHRMYSAVGGRYARVFSAVSEGWTTESASPPSVEEFATRFAEIDATSVGLVPMSLDEEFADVARRRLEMKS